MAQTPQVAVVGAQALRKDIDRLCRDERSPLFNAMKRAGYAAVQPVVPATRARIPSSGRRNSRWHKTGALAGRSFEQFACGAGGSDNG